MSHHAGILRAIFDKLWAGEIVDIRIRELAKFGSYEAKANEIRAKGTYYCGDLFISYICTAYNGYNVYTRRFSIAEDGTIGYITNQKVSTTKQ